jgi:RNA polymerase sigma-70 factor (ECF subfamily)
LSVEAADQDDVEHPPYSPEAVGGAHSVGDDELMASIADGSHEAFELLMRRHLNSIHGYLYRLTGSRAEAEDLAQDTFLRVWQKAGSFNPGQARLTTWLHTIAHRRAVDVFRRKRELPEMHGREHTDPQVGPGESRESDERQRLLDAALSSLPERQRAAILLCQVQGFNNAQTAEILGIGTRAVESLLARGRRSLRETLTAGGVLGDGNRPGRTE